VERVLADDVAGVRRTVSRLGELVGRKAEAEKLLAEIDAALARAEPPATNAPAPRVLFVVQHEPLRVAGGPSHISELLTAVGAVNVAADFDRPWPELSAESLVVRDPDMILDASLAPGVADDAALLFWDRFSSLSAVRLGRVHRMDESAVLRPGPRLPVALEYLRRIVRGEGR